MLRILSMFIVVSFLNSCANEGVNKEGPQNNIVTTREDGYRPQPSQTEKEIQGCWIENNENNTLWCFTNRELKWKGFTHIVSINKNEVKVGSLTFQVLKKNDTVIEFFNKTSKQNHSLTRD